MRKKKPKPLPAPRIPASQFEENVKTFFESNGYRYLPQKKIGRYTFDGYLPDLNILVRCQGDYFHCNPNYYDDKYYNKCRKKHAHEIWEDDARKNEVALEKGYHILEIWQSEFYSDLYKKMITWIMKNRQLKQLLCSEKVPVHQQ